MRDHHLMRICVDAGAVLAGLTALAGTGAAAHALSGGNAGATGTTMVLGAAALATKGRAYAQWCREMLIVGQADPYGAETASYARTTRSRKLAARLDALVRRARQPVTVIAVGTERAKQEGASTRWDDSVRHAAQAGAQITLFVIEEEAQDEDTAHTLAATHANVRRVALAERPDAWLVVQPVMAWSGARTDPEQALLWVEGVPEESGRKTWAEYRATGNVRRNLRMLEEYFEQAQACQREVERSGR